MAILIQTTCLMLFIGIVFTWPFPLIFERRIPIAYVHTSVEEGSGPLSSSTSLFDEMNRMIGSMHERFEHMFGWPTFPMGIYDPDYDLQNDYNDLLNNENQLHMDVVVNDNNPVDIQKKLDAVQPICTTILDSPTTISPRKSRRKKLPSTKTTTCIKELIINGQKHFLEEITTTDDKDAIVKHSKSYGAISVDTNQIQQ